MKSAMRAKDGARLSAIRLLLAALKQKEVDERVELSDADVLAIVDKMMKQRRESIAQFEKASRDDLAQAEKFELSVLAGYLPEQLGDAQLEHEVAQALSATGAAGAKDMGKVMGWLMPKVKGKADGGLVNQIVKAKLG